MKVYVILDELAHLECSESDSQPIGFTAPAAGEVISRAMAAGSESILEGTLERIVFQNPTSQWTVARVLADKGAEVTAVGSLLGVPIGTPLVLRGQWVDDPKFGRQFRIESYRTRTPETLIGIERYLGS